MRCRPDLVQEHIPWERAREKAAVAGNVVWAKAADVTRCDYQPKEGLLVVDLAGKLQAICAIGCIKIGQQNLHIRPRLKNAPRLARTLGLNDVEPGLAQDRGRTCADRRLVFDQ